MAKKSIKKTKKTGIQKEIRKGRIYVTATFNNTLISITDREGNVYCQSSAGGSGFKGARRATPFAATQTLSKVLDQMRKFRTDELEVYLKGAGSGREAVLRGLKASGVRISLIADITPTPHNGVRPKKKRRV